MFYEVLSSFQATYAQSDGKESQLYDSCSATQVLAIFKQNPSANKLNRPKVGDLFYAMEN